ncbi:MAG TPA: mechanosensitive ion channel family protein [Bryobacteraceae bacterium]|nr:mechanosensitive ion channel family protein [Bryobacteraceae bacterium]
MDFQLFLTNSIPILTHVGLKVIGAIALWIIGRWLIGVATTVLGRALRRQQIEETLIQWLVASVGVALNIALVVAILGYFGVETTTFAALIAAAGVAIGAAWAGLLANFAAGVFLVILRPFKVGDFVSVGGVTGTVSEIGLFATTIQTPENVSTFVGNNKIFTDTIQNFSTNSFRRVDRTAQLHGAVDANAAIGLLKEKLLTIPNVAATPGPEVEILDFNLMGPVLAVRTYTHTNHYWQVYFDMNRLIRETFGAAGYPAPEQQIVIRQHQA